MPESYLTKSHFFFLKNLTQHERDVSTGKPFQLEIFGICLFLPVYLHAWGLPKSKLVLVFIISCQLFPIMQQVGVLIRQIIPTTTMTIDNDDDGKPALQLSAIMEKMYVIARI